MTLTDIRNLITIMRDVEPGSYRSVEAAATWASTCGQMAQEIRKRKLVTDHQFSEGVFLAACLGQGEYILADPSEDAASWLAWDNSKPHRWRSSPKLEKEQA